MAKALCYSPDWCHLEADQFWMRNGEYLFDANRLREAHEWCQATAREYLTQGCDVVVSNTFTTVKELRPYFDIAEEFGIVPNVFVAQNQFGNVHNVPAETLAKMQARFAYDISTLFE
jgi:hypothetical protein